MQLYQIDVVSFCCRSLHSDNNDNNKTKKLISCRNRHLEVCYSVYFLKHIRVIIYYIHHWLYLLVILLSLFAYQFVATGLHRKPIRDGHGIRDAGFRLVIIIIHEGKSCISNVNAVKVKTGNSDRLEVLCSN